MFVFFCRYLLENIDWLEDDLGQYADEFIIVDCPGKGATSTLISF